MLIEGTIGAKVLVRISVAQTEVRAYLIGCFSWVNGDGDIAAGTSGTEKLRLKIWVLAQAIRGAIGPR
jgi:hypothetical protein